MGKRRKNGEGTARQIDGNTWEAIVQSSLLNPQTMNYKRFKRRGNTKESAIQTAKLACRAWEYEMSKGNNTKIDKKKTFGEYMQDYLNEVVKNSAITDTTFHSYYNNMNNMFFKYDISNYQLGMLNAQEFTNYYNMLLGKYTKKSVAFPIQFCKRLCKDLVKRQLIPQNFAEIGQEGIKKEKIDEYKKVQEDRQTNRKKVWTNEDIIKFYNSYKCNNGGEIVLIVLFLIETGIRAEEFAALTLDCIDTQKKIMIIEKSNGIRFKDNDNPQNGVEWYTKVPKGRESRLVNLSELSLELIGVMEAQTKARTQNPQGLLYPQLRTGKPRTSSSMEIGLANLCKKLDIDRDIRLSKGGQKRGCSLHTCRHTYASIANNANNASPIATSLSLGHKSLNTTEIYTHSILKDIKTAYGEVINKK
jgi:integrase